MFLKLKPSRLTGKRNEFGLGIPEERFPAPVLVSKKLNPFGLKAFFLIPEPDLLPIKKLNPFGLGKLFRLPLLAQKRSLAFPLRPLK